MKKYQKEIKKKGQKFFKKNYQKSYNYKSGKNQKIIGSKIELMVTFFVHANAFLSIIYKLGNWYVYRMQKPLTKIHNCILFFSQVMNSSSGPYIKIFDWEMALNIKQCKENLNTETKEVYLLAETTNSELSITV